MALRCLKEHTPIELGASIASGKNIVFGFRDFLLQALDYFYLAEVREGLR